MPKSSAGTELHMSITISILCWGRPRRIRAREPSLRHSPSQGFLTPLKMAYEAAACPFSPHISPYHALNLRLMGWELIRDDSSPSNTTI